MASSLEGRQSTGLPELKASRWHRQAGPSLQRSLINRSLDVSRAWLQMQDAFSGTLVLSMQGHGKASWGKETGIGLTVGQLLTLRRQLDCFLLFM